MEQWVEEGRRERERGLSSMRWWILGTEADGGVVGFVL